jgi:hypothetical protein
MSHSSWDSYFEKHIVDFVHDGGLKDQILDAEGRAFQAKSTGLTIHDLVEGNWSFDRLRTPAI